MINNRKSPIQDDYIEKYLAEKELNLTATLDAKAAYSDADFVVIAAPTNYDSHTQHFDTSAVEAVIKLVMEYNPDAIMVIKSTMSFFGGGTDMESFFKEYGGSVLSATFDKYCYVNVRHLPRFFDYSTELSYSKTERVTDINDIQHPAIRNAMKMLDMHEIRLTYFLCFLDFFLKVIEAKNI